MFARFYTFLLLLGMALTPASVVGAGRLQPAHPDRETPGTGVSGFPRDAGRALTDGIVWEQSVGRAGSRPLTGGAGFWALPPYELHHLVLTGEIALEHPHSRASRVKVRAVPSSPRAPPAAA